MNATEWAEDQQRRAELDDLMAQVADQEAQMEHHLITTHNDYAVQINSEPTSDADLSRRVPPPYRPATRRISRGC
ncbi:hypothetical protein ACFCX6_06770 [Streptomyces sp. NPDC056353]|uniref:hypothetical protein n=1 Tax=Streptomyces sp. NPDC056353 TaxID=3345792 RepID=UPI0035DBD531